MLNEDFLDYLADQNLIDKNLIEEDLNENGVEITSLRQFFLTRRYITESEFQKALSSYLGIEFKESIPEPKFELKDKFIEHISHRIAYKHLIFPIGYEDNRLTIALCDVSSVPVCESAADILGCSLEVVLTLEGNILDLIQKEYKIGAPEKLEQDDDSRSLDNISASDAEDILASDDDEPIRRLVNSMLFQATKLNASDVHIDPTADLSIVRNRMDGMLHQVSTIPKYGHNRIVNRVKIMAGLDISTRNVPQDGRTMILLAGKKVDIRVSIIPTIHGERVVLRLLQQSHQLLTIEQIGLAAKPKQLILETLTAPNGIVLVTGPTGSGKTTTLYSCLQSIDHNARNVITVEDPVEYQVSGYGQVQVNEKQGLTFAAGLRSILRQDPDVIMVGEIRDKTTAQIAIQSALTGHLVLSTLHTNDAVSTVVRLIDMGIESFLISSTLKCVVSQRLVRQLCSNCRKKEKKPWSEMLRLGVPQNLKEYYNGYIYEPVGCDVCSKSAYRGRMGVHEVLFVNDSLRSVITKTPTALALRNDSTKSGALITLAEDCYQKVFDGRTSMGEVSRLLFEIKQSQSADSLLEGGGEPDVKLAAAE